MATVYKINGRAVSRDEWLRNARGVDSGPPMAPISGNWPLESEAMGCHPVQIREYQHKLKSAGCPTDYTPDGRPILRSQGHRREVAGILGYYDKDGGYGDPMKKS